MKQRSTSVRVDEETLDRLRQLAESSGVSITKLITLATAAYLEHVETEGSISVPVRKMGVRADQKPRGT